MTERLGLIGLFPSGELPGPTWPTNCEDVQDLPFTNGRAFTSSLLCSTGPGDLLCAGRHRTGQHKGLTESVVFDQGSIGVVSWHIVTLVGLASQPIYLFFESGSQS
jgi:hypothetical protein